MNCKNCNAEMAEGARFCSVCGTDHADPAVISQQPKKKVWIPIVAAVCCLALVIGIVAGVYFMLNSESDELAVLLKESYTGTAAEVLAAGDTVIATAGDFELTNGELQIVYWTMYYDFLNYYGSYASYFLDYTEPLDEQWYDEQTGMTWQHYFLDTAIETWLRYEVLSAMGEEAGMEMSQELTDYLDGLYSSLETTAEENNFESVLALIQADYGAGGTFENLREYMRVYYYGNDYFVQLYEQQDPTDAEIDAYYTENEDMFVSAGYGKEDGNCINVRHILIMPGEDSTATYTDEEWAAAQTEAEAILDQWLAGDADEDSFAELANEHSMDPGSNTVGGLYENVMPGQMVDEFDEWIFAEGRQHGDYEIVRTSYGYHIMFYVEANEAWYEMAKSELKNEMTYDYLGEVEDSYDLTVNYADIVLGEVIIG